MRRHHTIIILLIFISFFHCQKSDSETLQYLEEQIQTGNHQEALELINERLTKINNSLSLSLNPNPDTQNLVSSLDGQTAAWNVKERFYYFTNDAEEVRNIEFEGNIKQFSLSHSGNMAVILYQNEDKCQLVVVDILKGTELVPDKNVTNCQQIVIISNDGQYLYIHNDKQIEALAVSNTPQFSLQISDKNIAKQSIPQNIPESNLLKKYKKIQHKMTLNQINQRGWSSFYGAGGAYHLIYYPGSGKKVITYKALIARPVLYPVFDGDSHPDDTLPEMDTKSSNKSFHFATANAFVYAGGAGARKLIALEFGADIKSGLAFTAPIWDHIQFIRDRNEFLVLKDEHLYYWNPVSDKRTLLPVLARQFSLFNGGLLYLDLTNNLYIRKQPFTQMEIKLVQLRQAATKKNETE